MTSDSSPPAERPRVAVLWSQVTGYVQSSLRALTDLGAEVLVVHDLTEKPSAPFDESVTSGLDAHAWRGSPDPRWLRTLVDGFEPTALLVNSWHIHPYRRLARSMAGRTVRVLCMDNQWRGTPKQWLGVLTSPLVLRPAYDAAFVAAGDRQAIFAGKLGFPAERVLWGMACCDYERFARVAVERGDRPAPNRFLYVGRLVEAKAVDVLVEAYRRYRATAAEPWPLLVAGAGSLEGQLSEIAGVEMLGFVQPDGVPGVMAEAGCLVLPSRFEPWAVAIHEAAAAGLPIVCTSASGASTRLVLDGYNGAVVSPDDAEGLAAGLTRVSGASAEDRRGMGEGSSRLAAQLTTKRWATYVLERTSQLARELGVPAARLG
jgi:glycosyltransferase involved in cell wall biosynthesis